MSKFVLIDNLPGGITAKDLARYLLKEQETKTVEKIWLDPFLEPRAVAMFKENIVETKKLQQKHTIFRDIVLKLITTTSSIFVRTFGLLSYGSTDWLYQLFSNESDGGHDIASIKKIDDDCCEIIFVNGWLAVKSVCDREWKVDNCKLSVCPYFDCFKEPVPEYFQLNYTRHEINRVELAEKKLDIGIEKSSNTKLNLPITSLQREFCIRYLKEKLMAIEENERTQIIIGSCRLEFNGASQNSLHKAHEQVEILLKGLHCLKAQLQYPGLLAYVRSKEGRQVIDYLSNKHQCVTEFPNNDAQEKRFDYKSILIGTAESGHLKIHLVQGDCKDLEMNLIVEFCPGATDQICLVEDQTSNHKIIYLPPWRKQYSSAGEDHWAVIRKSLQKTIHVVLKESSQSKCSRLFFATSEMLKTEFPLPIDCVAKILINELLRTSLPSTPQNRSIADVFICEMKSEAVFKAFTFYLEKNKMPLKPPVQDMWDSISIPTSMRNVKGSFGIRIEVMSSNPDFAKDGVLFCYPIQPDLKSATCPAILEYSCSQKMLQDNIRKLLVKKPDGLDVGEATPVHCFKNGKEAVVYCFPRWGPGCGKAIHAALKSCLLTSVDHCTVHIIPPGLHVFPSYPIKYLVATFSQVLYQLLTEGNLRHQKKIVLIVENNKYRKALRKELEHYFPEELESEWQNEMRNNIWAPENQDAHKDILVNETSCKGVPIVICGHSKTNTENLIADLNIKMQFLMRENNGKKELNKKETLLFQKIIQNVMDLPVNFVLEKHFYNLTTLPSKYFHDRRKESSELSTSELRKSFHNSYAKGKFPSAMENRASSFKTDTREISTLSSRERGKSPHMARKRETSHMVRERGSSFHRAREREKSPHTDRERESSSHRARDRGKSPHTGSERESSSHRAREREKSPHTGRERESSSHRARERGKSPHTGSERVKSFCSDDRGRPPRERETSFTGVIESPGILKERLRSPAHILERGMSLNRSLEIENVAPSATELNKYSGIIIDRGMLNNGASASRKSVHSNFDIRKTLTGSTLTVHGLGNWLIKTFMSTFTEACEENPDNLSRETKNVHCGIVDSEPSDDLSSESSISEDN